MSRTTTRLAAAAGLAAILTAAGCGGGSSGTDSSPKGELVSGVNALSDADALTTTLRLDTTSAKLQALAKHGGDSLSKQAADAITSARVVIETKGSGKDKTFALRGVEGNDTLVDLRVVDDTLYLQADLQAVFALAHKQNILANLKAEVAHLPAFVKGFVNGDWVSLNGTALSAIAGQFGAGTASAAPSAGPKLLADLRDIVNRDVTVTRQGSDARGDHLLLSGDTRTLANDVREALARSVPGGSALAGKVDGKNLPSRRITVDAWVKDGALSVLSLDLAQFADKGEVPAGTTLPITLTFQRSGGDISAPDGATPVDLTQLGTLLGAVMGGSSSSIGAGSGTASS